MEFDQINDLYGTYESSVNRVWAAWATLFSRYGYLQCPSAIGLLLNLYQEIVPPAGTYMGVKCGVAEKSHGYGLRRRDNTP